MPPAGARWQAQSLEIAESETAWGSYGRPMTDATGRYTVGSLPVRHYVARASRSGYDASPVVTIGFLETSRSLDFELTTTGLVTGPLAVTALDPAAGSTGGGTDVTITGTGFRTGTTVTFGGERTTAYVHNSTTIYTTTPVHAAATVDVIVTKPDGESVTLTGGFRYAAPQSFNFNGAWIGYALAHPFRETGWAVLHSDMDMQFTIQDNVLTGFTCGGATIALRTPPPAVSNGEFSFAGERVTLTGRIVSDGRRGRND